MDATILLQSLLVMLTVCIVVVHSAAVPDQITDDEAANLETISADVMACADISSLGLSIVRGDSIYSSAQGVTDWNTALSANKRTMFTLGSTAKAFVPYILAEILNGKDNKDGRIGWDSTIKDILHHSDHQDIEVPSPWAEIKLKDLLVYQSGSSAADISTMVGLPDGTTREELLRRMTFLPETKEFRTTNHYTNYMYTIAAHLAERVTGLSWNELIKTLVLDKLNMTETSFTPDGLYDEDAARAIRYHPSDLDDYHEQNVSLFNFGPSSPIGSLMMSGNDMAKWMKHLLNILHAKGSDSGINEPMKHIFKEWVAVPEDHAHGLMTHESEVALGYGMGWFSSQYRGLHRLAFRGSMYAFSSQIWLFPEVDVAVFLALSGPGKAEQAQRALEAILSTAADVALRKPIWATEEQACCCKADDYDDDYYYDEDDDHYVIPGPYSHVMISYLSPVTNYIGEYGNGVVGDVIVQANIAGVLNLTLGRNLRADLMPDKSKSVLRFSAQGILSNTEEWTTEKIVEFMHKSETDTEKPYDILRLHVSDAIFYDFERGKLFTPKPKIVPTTTEIPTTTISTSTPEITPENGFIKDDDNLKDKTNKKENITNKDVHHKVAVEEIMDQPKQNKDTESSRNQQENIFNKYSLEKQASSDKNKKIDQKDSAKKERLAQNISDNKGESEPLNDDIQARAPETPAARKSDIQNFLGDGRDTHNKAEGGYVIKEDETNLKVKNSDDGASRKSKEKQKGSAVSISVSSLYHILFTLLLVLCQLL